MTENWIYSEVLDEVIQRSFTHKKHGYTWNEDDLLWYRDDTDERWFMEIPEGCVETIEPEVKEWMKFYCRENEVEDVEDDVLHDWAYLQLAESLFNHTMISEVSNRAKRFMLDRMLQHIIDIKG